MLLVAAGFGALKLLRGDYEATLTHWVHVLRIDPDNRYIHGALAKAFSVSHKQLRALSVGTFVYAALRFTEGIGLVLRKAWGEYLTVIATAIFIPLEIYEMVHHLMWVKVVVFVLNVATVWYLIYNLRHGKRAKSSKRT
jgi:uncharacterized membrane protein (DUF2068 family)